MHTRGAFLNNMRIRFKKKSVKEVKRGLSIFLPLLILCLIAGEAFGGFLSRGRNINEDSLSVYIKQEAAQSPHPFRRGAVSRMVFTVENAGDDFIIVRNFKIQDQLPDIYRWYGAVYGGTEYMPLEDAWVFSELEQRLSEPVFATGVIYPGGKLDVTRYLILRDAPIGIELTYQKVTKKDSSGLLYFYFRGNDELGSCQKYKRLPHPDVIPVDAIDWERVIFPEADSVPLKQQRFYSRIRLEEHPFRLKDAEKKAGMKAESYVYWERQQAWIIGKDKKMYRVSSKEVMPLPEIDPLIFVIMASAYKTIDVILPMTGYDGFHAIQPKVEGPGYFNPGITPLPEDEMLSLFNIAREKGDSISALAYDSTGLGKRFYLLVGRFDEKKRRDVIGTKD